MRIFQMFAGAALSLAVLPAVLAAQQRDQPFSASIVMTPEEMRATGVSTLSARQRAALDAWLRLYTERVLAEAATRGREPAAPPIVRDAPLAPPRDYDAGPPPRRRSRVVAPAGTLSIVSLIDGGDVVRLENNAVYRVYGRDHTKSSAWRLGDYVYAREAPVIEGDDFDTLLTNANDGTKVLAKLSRPD
ncbi:MAG: hypothetical protein ABJD07_07295 [Gemmatimonadaceae bacterium]